MPKLLCPTGTVEKTEGCKFKTCSKPPEIKAKQKLAFFSGTWFLLAKLDLDFSRHSSIPWPAHTNSMSNGTSSALNHGWPKPGHFPCRRFSGSRGGGRRRRGQRKTQQKWFVPDDVFFWGKPSENKKTLKSSSLVFYPAVWAIVCLLASALFFGHG